MIDETKINSAINDVLFRVEGNEKSFEMLISASDAAVPHILNYLQVCAKGNMEGSWWNGAPELCVLLSKIKSTDAKKGLIEILRTNSHIYEFNHVRAEAAKELGTFNDADLIKELLGASKLPNAPLLQIKRSIEALGGKMPVSPDLIIEEGSRIGKPNKEKIQYFKSYEKEVSKWPKDSQEVFYWFYAHAIKNEDGEEVAVPYYVAGLLAHPHPDNPCWNGPKNLFNGIERTPEMVKRLAKKYPLPSAKIANEHNTNNRQSDVAEKKKWWQFWKSATKAESDDRWQKGETPQLEAGELINKGFALDDLQKAKMEVKETRKKEENPEIITNSIDMEFVKIPAGEFNMGSPSNEAGRYPNEGPVHRVKIRKAFYMGKYEVTQKQWRDVMGNNPSDWKGDNLPVVPVSWNDVQEFIKKLNKKERTNKYRLPTEAEWEYAARAETTTRFSFGDDETMLGDYAWYYPKGSHQVHQVGRKKPNPWGLYDMHGNVWEWVQDNWHKDYNGAPTDGSAWESVAGSERGSRGGSWSSVAKDCRSANRDYEDPGIRNTDLGFRLMRVL